MLALGVSACATIPLKPDPSVQPLGRWTVVAVNGQPTGGGERFYFVIDPPAGEAQFGCNKGGGSLSVDDGWVVTGNWIITVAGCLPRGRMRFEDQGYAITSQPMAMERTARGIRLRNRAGSVDLVPAPVAAEGSLLIRTDPWRETERGCFDPTGQRDVMATEVRAFRILTRPLTVAPTADTLRLQSVMGTIDLVRRP